MWLGGNYSIKQGAFIWATSGYPVNFSYWLDGQPINMHAYDCVLMKSIGIKWINKNCSSTTVPITLCEVVSSC